MNRNYRIVFNRKLGIHQVASEHTRAQGIGGAVVKAAGLAVTLLAGLHLAPALAVDLTIAGGVSINSAGDADYGYIAVGSSGTGVASLTIDSGHTYTGSLLLTAGNVSEGSVTVSGTGSTLTFSGANIGTVANGTLLIENGGTVGGSSMNIGYGHSGSGMVTVTGAGSTLNITDYLRVARVGDGILNIENGGKVSVNGLLTVGYGGNGTLNLLGTSGNRGILETAALRGGSGAVTINGGILRATTNQSDFFQDFNPGEVVIGSGGFFFDTNGYDVGADIDLEGTGGLTKQGTGTLTLTGKNIYSGGTTVEAGTLQIGNGGTTGSILGNITNDSALTFNRSDAQTYAGIISGTGSFTKLGTGSLTLSGKSTYSGTTTVSAGTLQAGVANAIDGSSALTVESGATFDLHNFAQAIGSLAGGGNVTLGSAFLTVGEDNSDTTFSGSISGTGGTNGLSKGGSGT